MAHVLCDGDVGYATLWGMGFPENKPRQTRSFLRKQGVVRESLMHGKDALVSLFGSDIKAAIEGIGRDRVLQQVLHHINAVERKYGRRAPREQQPETLGGDHWSIDIPDLHGDSTYRVDVRSQCPRSHARVLHTCAAAGRTTAVLAMLMVPNVRVGSVVLGVRGCVGTGGAGAHVLFALDRHSTATACLWATCRGGPGPGRQVRRRSGKGTARHAAHDRACAAGQRPLIRL